MQRPSVADRTAFASAIDELREQAPLDDAQEGITMLFDER